MSTSKELLASKVVFYDVGSGVPENYQVPTAVSGVVVLSEMGPIGVPTLVTSETEYNQIFGGFSTSCRGAEIARGFFAMGGKFLWVVRTCHYTDPTNPLSATAVKATGTIAATTAVPSPAVVVASLAAPYSMVDGDWLDINVGGMSTAAVFLGFPAQRPSANGPFNLNGGENIQLRFDGGPIQNIILDAPAVLGAMTVDEYCASINRYCYGGKAYPNLPWLYFVLESDTVGTDSIVEVIGGTATGAGLMTVGVTNGSGNYGNIRGITTADIKSVVEAAVAGVVVNLLPGNLFNISTIATGIIAQLQIEVTSSAAVKMGLDNAVHTGTASGSVTVIQLEGLYEGAYGHTLTFEILDASSGTVLDFNMNILKNGVVVERHANLSMSPLASNYFVTILNANSSFIQAIDPVVGTRPTNGVQGPLAGGDDGLVGLVDADYIGTSIAKNGLYAYEDVAVVNLLAIPGVATPVVANGLVNYCEIVRGGLPHAILEGPQGSSATQIVTYQNVTANLQGLSDCGSIFWPWLLIGNPDTSIYGTDDTIVTPPSAIMMGRAAMTDQMIEGGVYQPFAGPIYGTLGIVLGVDHEDAQDERKRDLVYPNRINPIRSMKNTPYFNDGSRTLKESTLYPGIGQRRGRSHIEEELGYMLEYVRHLRTNRKNRQEAARIVDKYMKEQCRLGAFTSDIPEEAYDIDVGDGINTPAEEDARRMNIRIRMRMAGSYDWIIVYISKKTA